MDSLTPIEALAVCVTMEGMDNGTVPDKVAESAWITLKANAAELESTKESKFEDIYQPDPVWQRPEGHAAWGIDAFKVLCHVNCLKEAAAIVVGDSGAALMLISEKIPQRT